MFDIPPEGYVLPTGFFNRTAKIGVRGENSKGKVMLGRVCPCLPAPWNSPSVYGAKEGITTTSLLFEGDRGVEEDVSRVGLQGRLSSA